MLSHFNFFNVNIPQNFSLNLLMSLILISFHKISCISIARKGQSTPNTHISFLLSASLFLSLLIFSSLFPTTIPGCQKASQSYYNLKHNRDEVSLPKPTLLSLVCDSAISSTIFSGSKTFQDALLFASCSPNWQFVSDLSSPVPHPHQKFSCHSLGPLCTHYIFPPKNSP